MTGSYTFIKIQVLICFHYFPVNGQLQIIRGCTWKRTEDLDNQCPSTSNSRSETTTYCETCEYDGCNSATTLGKTLALLVAPLTLLLFK